MGYIDRDLGLRMYNMQPVLHSILLAMWQGLCQAVTIGNRTSDAPSKEACIIKKTLAIGTRIFLCKVPSKL